jgi:hypothetical protein
MTLLSLPSSSCYNQQDDDGNDKNEADLDKNNINNSNEDDHFWRMR